jgi:Na+/proline symporter
MQAYVAVVSVFYMFIFMTAELTAVGGVVGLLTGAAERSLLWLAPIALVALVTTAYTVYGGLPASLRTDRFQAWLILAIVPLAAYGIVRGVDEPAAAMRSSGLMASTGAGWSAFAVLCIAVAAANLFHQGYWQRSWAAVDRRTLVRGAVGGALLTLPVIGLTGILARGAGAVADPAVDPGAPVSIAFFSLLTSAPPWLVGVIIALSVALVASSVDTLENALAATFAADVTGGRLSLAQARWMTLALTLPAVGLALANLSVLQLFLAADLLAAATVVPVFLGLDARTDRRAALAGAVAGLLGVVALGVVRDGTLAAGLRLLVVQTGPAGLDLGAFVVAPVVAGVVTVVGSWAAGRR